MKNVILWIAAVVLTLTAAVYQRLTGPTYEKKTEVVIDGTSYKLALIRTHETTADALVELTLPDEEITGTIYYRRFPTQDPWKSHEMIRMKTYPDVLAGPLPVQPAAGKIEYFLVLHKNGLDYPVFPEEPVVLRYKDPVPPFILVPHVLLMFFAMLFSTAALLFAISGGVQFRTYTMVTFWLLLAGGMILGPLVQKFAFGSLWTGVPFGWDLTDNKTLIAFLGFLVAFLGNRKKSRPGLTIAPAILLLLVFSIPHSMFGSELDYEKGEIIQAMIPAALF